MGKTLNARIVPNWTCIIGAMEGSLRAIGETHSTAYLMGTSGHAFRLNIETTHVCLDGPSSIDWTEHLPLYDNLGYGFEEIYARRGDDDFSAQRERALNDIILSIERGVPALLWAPDIAEFGLVVGYDGENYIVSSVIHNEPFSVFYGDVPADTDLLHVFLIGAQHAVDPCVAAREALEFALDVWRGQVWQEQDHRAGLEGWNAWEAALRDARAVPNNHAYNVRVVQGARQHAAEYLNEIAPLFDADARDALMRAALHFDRLQKTLRAGADLFPIPASGDVDGGTVSDPARWVQGANLITDARALERAALNEIIRAVGEDSADVGGLPGCPIIARREEGARC
jgi:hypothetical protein